MKPILKFVACIFFIGAVVFVACKKEHSCENCLPNSPVNGTNRPPLANAGPDQLISLPTDSARLDGSMSSDPDNNISTYQWRKISGPASFSLVSTTSPISLAKFLVQGIYQFVLKVTDSTGLSSDDTVQLNVNVASTSEPITIAGCSSMTTIGHMASPGMGSITTAGTKIFFHMGIPNPTPTTIYDTLTHSWSTSSEYFTGIETGTKLVEATYTYGIDNERFEIYDATNNSRNTYTVPESRAFIQHDITGNKLVFAGGFYPDHSIPGASKRVDIYDFASNTWSLVKYDSASRGMTVAAIGNKIFFAGGYYRIRYDTLVQSCDDDGSNCSWYNPQYAIAKMDIYDMASHTWSVRQLSDSSGGIVTAKAGNKLLFFHRSSTKIDIYDASTDSWSVAQKTDQSHWSRAHTVGNKILLTYLWSDKVGIYDVTTGSWTSHQLSKPNAQTDYLVAVVQNKILFFYVFDYEDHSTAVDTYDATTNTWCHGELSRSLVRSGIKVAGNRIYIAGGLTRTNPNQVYNQWLDNIWLFSF